MAAAAAGGAAPCGPRPNPSDDWPSLRSPSGKGKPVALADITNTGRRNATGSISVADLVKENAKLLQLLNEKTRAMELRGVEMQKLRFAVQVIRQQNLQLAQANSQMLAELNLGKDRLKALQHELSCATAVIKVKDSELEKRLLMSYLQKRNKAAYQQRKEVNAQDGMKATPSKVAAGVAHQIDGSVTSATEHHLVESTSVATSITLCQEPSNDVGTKRGRNKRKSKSSDCSNIMQDHYGPQLQTAISLGHEDIRRPVRRSTRLNPVSCEDTEIACSILPDDDVVPSDPSGLINQKRGPAIGKDMRNSLQDERNHEGVMASVSKINEQSLKEANSKDIQEAYSSPPGIEVHQISDTSCKTTGSYSAETQSSLPSNIVEPPKAVEDTGNKRGTRKRKLKNRKYPAIEHAIAKCNSSTREPLHHDEKRKCQRRKTAQLNSVLSENTMCSSETQHGDVVSSLPHSRSNPSRKRATNQKQADGCSSTKDIESQVAGRRSLRWAAGKVVSYKEIPLNVKMRRP